MDSGANLGPEGLLALSQTVKPFLVDVPTILQVSLRMGSVFPQIASSSAVRYRVGSSVVV